MSVALVENRWRGFKDPALTAIDAMLSNVRQRECPMHGMAGSDEWQTLLGAWLREQRPDREEITLDLNKEMILRNALPLGAVWDGNWWGADAEHADAWRAHGWKVTAASNLAGIIVFKRLDAT
jgi:hypothetical protein